MNQDYGDLQDWEGALHRWGDSRFRGNDGEWDAGNDWAMMYRVLVWDLWGYAECAFYAVCE